MNADEFRATLPDALRVALPSDLQQFRHTRRHAFVQFWYGEPSFHYEVWTQTRYNVIEVGLHLEHKDAKRNTALHQFFDERFIEIRHALGDMWLEQWDKGWHKLYKTMPLTTYNDALVEAVSRELARQIIVLQPMLWEGVQHP